MRVVLNKRNSLVEVPSTEETLSVIVQTTGKAFIKFHGNQLHSIGCAEGKELTLLSTLPEFWHTDLTYLLYVDNYTLRFATSKPCQRIPLPVTNISTGQVEPEGILGGISTEEDQESGLTMFVFGSQSDYYGDNAVVTPNQSVEQFPNKEWLIGDFTQAQAPAHVDMGLSVDWSTVNVGAETPESTGHLFRYGDTTDQHDLTSPTENDPFSETSDLVAYLLEHQGDYTTNDEVMEALLGVVNTYAELTGDTTTVSGMDVPRATLLSTMDPVSVAYGDGYRLPTLTELQELLDNTTKEIVVVNDTKCVVLTSTVPGYESSSITIPLAGVMMYNTNDQEYQLYMEGEGIYTWLSSLEIVVGELGLGFFDVGALVDNNGSTYELLSEGIQDHNTMSSQIILVQSMSEIMDNFGSYGDENHLRFLLLPARGVHEK